MKPQILLLTILLLLSNSCSRNIEEVIESLPEGEVKQEARRLNENLNKEYIIRQAENNLQEEIDIIYTKAGVEMSADMLSASIDYVHDRNRQKEFFDKIFKENLQIYNDVTGQAKIEASIVHQAYTDMQQRALRQADETYAKRLAGLGMSNEYVLNALAELQP